MDRDSDAMAACGPQTALREMVEELRTGGAPWRRLLSDGRYPALQQMSRWFTNAQQGVFYRLVAPDRRLAFLEVGAGCGIVSACLSEEYETGYALESSVEFVEFMEQRFRLDSIDNVQILHADPLGIPLAENSVDLVVANGLQACLGRVDERGGRRPLQLRALREFARCLRDGGKLVIAADNAWHVPDADRHEGVPSDRGRFLRSYFGYKRLLREAGYRNVRVFVVKPSYRLPVDVYSCDMRALQALFEKHHAGSRVKRTVKRISDLVRVPYLWAYFERSYYLVASK